MANAEAGSAYISIIPSMKGFDSKLSSGIGDAVSKAGKVAAAAFAAVGAGAVAAGKMALDSYSDYEQLSGGIKKIFGDAAGQVEGYAREAYVKAGLSANDYMRQVSSFSASLKQSFGGDVVKAAERANMAMVDMSDNANVFGSNMEDVQNAYQGFAKQNYTMLDNLKLGYGGTKTEMERLISDANAWEKANGKAGDLSISKFGDVVQAIHDVQEAQGIAGDTAAEASSTIAGSVAMAKAAWENFLTGLGDEHADMGQLTDDLLQSIETVAKNVGPRVRIIGERIVAALPQVAKMVGDAAYALLLEAISGAWDMVSDAMSGLGISMPTLDMSSVDDGLRGAMDLVTQFGQSFSDGFSSVTGTQEFSDAMTQAGDSLSQLLADAQPVLDFLSGPFAQGLGELAGGTLQTVVQAVGDVASGFAQVTTSSDFQDMVSKLMEVVQPFVENVLQPLADILSGPVATALGQIAGILAYGLLTAIVTVMEVLTDGSIIIQQVAGFFTDTLPGAIDFVVAKFEAIGTVVTFVFNLVVGIVSMVVGQIVGFFTQTVPGGIDQMLQFFSQLPGQVLGFLAVVVSGIAGWVGQVASQAAQAGSSFVSAVGSFFSSVPGVISGALAGVTGIVSGVFSGVVSAIGSAISKAKSVVKGGLDAIAGFFSGLHLSLPHISLPHFSISGSFSLDPPSVPYISVSWYARGGIAESMAVLGESGAEAIVPYTNGNIRPWARALATAAFGGEVAPGGGDGGEAVLGELRALRSEMANLMVYVDGRALVGAIGGRMDQELGGRRAVVGRGF